MSVPPSTSWPPIAPVDVELVSGDARLAVDLRGGGIRALTAGDWDVVDGYRSGAVPAGRRGGLLLPWPNRLRDGRWRWAGRDLQLDVAAPDKPNALHGLLSWQPFAVLSRFSDAVTVGTTVEPRPGYPFRLLVALDYALGPERLSVTVRVRNASAEPAPFGVGMHPYIAVGGAAAEAIDGAIADADLTVPARTALVTDGGLPTGERTPFEGAVGRIGDRAIDTPLTDLDRDDEGWARVRLSGRAGTVELAVDRSWPWLQVYTGDTLPAGQRRRSVAVEPMTCPPNALADGVDLVVLEPAARWSGTWTLTWTPGG